MAYPTAETELKYGILSSGENIGGISELDLENMITRSQLRMGIQENKSGAPYNQMLIREAMRPSATLNGIIDAV